MDLPEMVESNRAFWDEAALRAMEALLSQPAEEEHVDDTLLAARAFGVANAMGAERWRLLKESERHLGQGFGAGEQ